MNKTRIILVGGFLGAGKTTLLARTAQILAEKGSKVSLITNDQAADLVDTALFKNAALDVSEIAGGCFCCRFNEFVGAAERLVQQSQPDVILGEPVGSCTDLCATVMQPLKDLYSGAYELAPLSVLVDPARLFDVIAPADDVAMHPSALYILRKQLEEADTILINKIDLLNRAQQADLAARALDAFPGKFVRLISAAGGDGVEEWVAASVAAQTANPQIVDVDYDIYAEGEAVLGWLNASATFQATGNVNWQALALSILDRVQRASRDHNSEIAHVKLAISAEGSQLTANLTSSRGIPTVCGKIDGSPSEARLILNARVEMAPDTLRRIVEDVLRSPLAPNAPAPLIETLHCLSPGRPEPTHRYAATA